MDIVLVKVSFLGLEMLMVEGIFLGEVGIRYSPVIGIDTDSSTCFLHFQIREIL